jgi:replicative DNA helicase
MIEKITKISDLGTEYQIQLFNEIITDHKFGLTIIDIIDKQYFANEAFAKIAHLVKDYHTKHQCLLNFPALRSEVSMQITTAGADTFKQQLLDTIDNIEKCKINNLNVQETAQRFCKMQSLKTAVNQIKSKLDKGILQDVDMIEETLKKALSFRQIDEPIDLEYEIDDVLSDDYREPIPTGIKGIDKITNGGLAKGELALIIAPLGVGKTTMLTKIASTAYQAGRNVLQIFFEDNKRDVQRKHYCSLTEVPLNELSMRKDEVKKKIKIATGNPEIGKLFIMKLSADGCTVNVIKNLIKRINSKGDKVDLVIIDYLDCLSAEKEFSGSEEWSNEGKIMRQCEGMIAEMNVAGWVATQGNRSSTSVEVVKTENMGGNLKKAQIAHLIVSVGKTLEQKESKRATITILKNRMGEDGMIFQNCLFDNGRMLIDTEDIISIQGFEDRDKDNRQKALAEKLKDIRIKRESGNAV